MSSRQLKLPHQWHPAVDHYGVLGNRRLQGLAASGLGMGQGSLRPRHGIGLRNGTLAAIGTSNFCGPHFVGLWRDIR